MRAGDVRQRQQARPRVHDRSLCDGITNIDARGAPQLIGGKRTRAIRIY
jgi:hypothetical protein